MNITHDTEGKLDARIFLSAIASRYKNRRYLHVAAQRRPWGRGYTLWYRAARKSRTWLKGQRMEEVERERERERGGRYRRESANGSINFMGALRWFQGCCLVGIEYKGCLAWESRAPTIISPFHQEFPSYQAPFPWCSVRFSLVDAGLQRKLVGCWTIYSHPCDRRASFNVACRRLIFKHLPCHVHCSLLANSLITVNVCVSAARKRFEVSDSELVRTSNLWQIEGGKWQKSELIKVTFEHLLTTKHFYVSISLYKAFWSSVTLLHEWQNLKVMQKY